jgi:acyl-CoA thioesterase I
MNSCRNLRAAAVILATACISMLPFAAPASAAQLLAVEPHAQARLTASAAAIAARHSLRIVAFGSSSTQGTGASAPAATYPSRLQVELRATLPAGVTVSVFNRGIGGEDAEDMIRRLPGVLAEKPDLVIWQTGTNDPLRGLPLERFVALTRQGIATMRQAGLDVMLMEPQDCPVFSAKPGALQYRDAVRALGAELGVPVIRRYDLMDRWLAAALLTRAQIQSPDGLHMSDAGYALLARAVASAIVADMPATATATAPAAAPNS